MPRALPTHTYEAIVTVSVTVFALFWSKCTWQVRSRRNGVPDGSNRVGPKQGTYGAARVHPKHLVSGERENFEAACPLVVNKNQSRSQLNNFGVRNFQTKRKPDIFFPNSALSYSHHRNTPKSQTKITLAPPINSMKAETGADEKNANLFIV